MDFDSQSVYLKVLRGEISPSVWGKINLIRYKEYKKFIRENGGDMELFNIPYIDALVKFVIIKGDLRQKVEGRSPIYYKEPNEDGTFDICGRMDGYYVDLCYKMMRYEDGIKLCKFEFKYGRLSTNTITKQDIIINLKDNTIHFDSNVSEFEVRDYTLLKSLADKNYIKR